MQNIHISALTIFFTGVVIGAATAIYVYRKLSPRVCAAEKKLACAIDDLKR